MLSFLKTQIQQISDGGYREFIRKLFRFKDHIIDMIENFLFFPFAAILVLCIRSIRSVILIRLQPMIYYRIGHYAANTELYLCEKKEGINVPQQRYFDVWIQESDECNQQLKKMWKRIILIFSGKLPALILHLNLKIPGHEKFTIGTNTNHDRDVHNLLDKYPPSLEFTPEEEEEGRKGLEILGIPYGSKFICLTVRDSAYLKDQSTKANLKVDWSYHDYRDGNIQNYIPMMKEMIKKGYRVIRMGAVVNDPVNYSDPCLIDYATSGKRSDFMDIYLGAKCEFCVSTGTGFDAVPFIFRRPVVYVNHVPLGVIATFSDKFISSTKYHWLKKEQRYMTFGEIFKSGAAYFFTSREFQELGIELHECGQDEITQIVLEMEAKVSGNISYTEEDNVLQAAFWNLFDKRNMHGKIKSRIGADFLRRNKQLLSG